MISLKKWLRSITGIDDRTIEITCQEIREIAEKLSIEKIAFWSIVNRIANAVSKCEFRTYVKNKEVKGEEYYLWNYAPNKNQTSDTFLKEIVSRLYMDNEALVIEDGGGLYVADSFSKNENGTTEMTFEGVTINGIGIGREYKRRDVLYFKLNHENMRPIVKSMYELYQNLIEFSIKAYKKSKGSRGILNIDSIASGNKDFEQNIKKLLEKDFKEFFNSENGVLPLFKGYDYNDLNEKTYSGENTRDIKGQMDDVFDFMARGFNFPPSLAKGDVQDTDKAVDEMLTFCLDPLVDMIETEINRQRNGKSVLKGTFVKVDTAAVKHIDLMDVGTSVDKLIGSGVACINDILRLIGMPQIEESWAYEHFLTKNYSTFAEALNQMQRR